MKERKAHRRQLCDDERDKKGEKFLDVTPGSVSIMGLMNDKENNVQLLVDEDVLKPVYVGCHPCINTSSIRLRSKDVFETYLNAVHHDYITVKLLGVE